VLLSKGESVGQVVRKLGTSDVTYYRWRKEYGGMQVEQAKRLAVYNSTPHEALNNISPNDVYAGRKEVILQKRREKKRLTMERRRQYNLYRHSTNIEGSDQHQDATSNDNCFSHRGTSFLLH
jgi:hypothetical protein